MTRSVLDFIGLELPKTTSDILTFSAKTWFSKESRKEDVTFWEIMALASLRQNITSAI